MVLFARIDEKRVEMSQVGVVKENVNNTLIR